MGAEQSSSRTGGQAQSASGAQKRCYYEVLGLDRHAADDEIRKAYKKKALELHPDRNFDDVENATRKFAEVQTAYEVLSDPQERAWYDSHRDAILAGNDATSDQAPTEYHNVRLTSAEDIFKLMGRFNSSVPMTDSQSGFFGILGGFFDQLATEETAACEWEGLTSVDYPSFGSAKDDYDAVAKSFYNTWTSFSTRKQFSWKDKYRLTDAPDRRIRRLMEKENKKLREEGIRDFNDAVRSLVAFVKKRDPRYVPNTQSETERQQVLRDSAAAQAARSRAANQEKLEDYVLPEWAQSRGEHDHHDEFSMTEEDSEVEHIECVVCNKTFKSENQFAAHEKSKKHIKAVQQLRRQMKKENADFDLQQEDVDSKGATKEASSDGMRGSEDESSEDAPPATVEDKEGILNHAGRDAQAAKDGDSNSAETSGDEDYAPRAEVQNRLVSDNALGTRTPDTDTIASGVDDLEINGQRDGRKVGKAKAKREKKAARAAAGESVIACAVCKEAFPSRTRLFAHIKELDHGVPVSQKPKAPKVAKKHKEKYRPV